MTVATEELGKVWSRAQPIKSSCMVPPETTNELVVVIRTMVPVVTGTSTLRAPLAMDFCDGRCPPASHNDNYFHFWLQDTVEFHQLLLDKIAYFAMSDFDGTHAAFRLMITCAVRRYGFLLRTLPTDFCQQYLVAAHIAVRTIVFRLLGVSHDVYTLDELNCAKFQLSLPTEFKGLNVPSL
jgi:hypothetical protein